MAALGATCLQRDMLQSRRGVQTLRSLLGEDRLYLASEGDVLPLCDLVAATDGDLVDIVQDAVETLKDG